MKKYINFAVIIFAMSFVLIACSDDNNAANDENSNSDNISEEKGNENDESSNESNGLEENSEKTNDANSESDLEITEEDQEDLKMGDTGT